MKLSWHVRATSFPTGIKNDSKAVIFVVSVMKFARPGPGWHFLIDTEFSVRWWWWRRVVYDSFTSLIKRYIDLLCCVAGARPLFIPETESKTIF